MRPVDLPVPLDPELDGEVLDRRGRPSSRSQPRALVSDLEEEQETLRRVFRDAGKLEVSKSSW